MIKVIIALQGKGKTGKTTTLKKLIEIIKSKKHKVTELPINSRLENDEVIVAEINGKNVGITTRGDNADCLTTDFNAFNEHNCELCVCACRGKGETVDFLEKQSKDGTLIYHGEWYVETKGCTDLASDIEKANTYQAQIIYDEIIRIL